MLKPGDLIQGYEVVTSHRNLTNYAKGIILAVRRDTDEFVVSEVTLETLEFSEWCQGHYFDSYVHAVNKLHKMIDEEALLYYSDVI